MIKRVEAGGHRTNPARRVQEWTIRKLKGTCMCQHLRVPNNFCMENEVSRGAPARIFVRAREGCSRPLSGLLWRGKETQWPLHADQEMLHKMVHHNCTANASRLAGRIRSAHESAGCDPSWDRGDLDGSELPHNVSAMFSPSDVMADPMARN